MTPEELTRGFFSHCLSCNKIMVRVRWVDGRFTYDRHIDEMWGQPCLNSGRQWSGAR